MSDIPPKPWSVDVFQQHRSHLTTFVDSKIVPLIRSDECCRILIRAPVKSGKREIAEYTAMRDHIAGEPKRAHVFASAWHRVADDKQREELRDHNLHVSQIINNEKAAECIAWIRSQILLGRKVVVHLDECDYGTGSRQILGRIWRELRDNPHVTTILYSATPEEVLYSGEVEEDADVEDMMDEMISNGCCLRYTPPSGFCGPAEFLAAGLVEEAKPFFRKTSAGGFELTAQGREICRGLCKSIATHPERNMIVLRLSYSEIGQQGGRANRKQKKSIYQFLNNIGRFPELAGFLVLVDKGEDFESKSPLILKERIQWSNTVYWRSKATGIPTLIVIDQTSSRSTEWDNHHRVYATHDFRNILQFGTISQAQERVNHYTEKYGGFQPIRVYGNVKTFQLSAGHIDYPTYLSHEWMDRKVDRRRAGEAELYEIKRRDTGALHPECPVGGVSRAERDRILQEVGCYADCSLSARVRGKVKQVPKVRTQWFACNRDTFDRVISSPEFVAQAPDYRPINPFLHPRMEGDRFMGNLRMWKVFDFAEVEEDNGGINRINTQRILVCYRNGELGIALRTLDGYDEQNSLAAFNSMYVRRG